MTMKDWLRREIEAADNSPHAWLHLVYEMECIYNATRNSVTGFSPYFYMIGRDFNGQKRLELQDRLLSLLESEKGTEAMVRDAVAAVHDRRAQLEQQSRANIRREDVPLLPVGSQQAIGYCLRRAKKARIWSTAMSSVWGRRQMWCDEADLECYVPLVPGSGTKYVLPTQYNGLLKRMFPDKDKQTHFKQQVEKCFAFVQSAKYRGGRIRVWGELQLSENGVELPARR
ncbi:hypothetical protein SARC_00199 [Sphaeroforma arctica JP610]|uniref:Uncharacterized protein n=1 Tax=Sphaeroforma arctica JP610 TaxID=667725 RepID=A0A0L0GFA8_9EUKA|nr:hypothetical protein SARC_00199 [Sphaeroforma arctica JP610]KNC87692.1 hypothetical protein SARC_00199 [Sphaeroforma arctica JP610]|eukprot:XP_014161594.1 hypothetical protein SARC_00199 [Sphaeroforma arctica JP610]